MSAPEHDPAQGDLFASEPRETEKQRRIRSRNEFAARVRAQFTHADVNPLMPAGWDPELDKVRLKGQMAAVAQCLSNGEWWTLRMLANASGGSEAGVSARIRDLRKRRFGAHTIEAKRRSRGTWQYRLVKGAQ